MDTTVIAFIMVILAFVAGYWQGYIYGKREGIEHQRHIGEDVLRRVIQQWMRERRGEGPIWPTKEDANA